MTVSTVNRRKNMRACACFYVTQYQLKRLNDALEFTLTSSLTHKRNMKKFSFLPKSSPVQPCRPLQAKFYETFKHFHNERGTNSATMHVKNSGWGMSNFQDLLQKRNSTSAQHNLLFSCNEDVNLSYQRQSFCQFEAYENNRNAANTNCFTI